MITNVSSLLTYLLTYLQGRRCSYLIIVPLMRKGARHKNITCSLRGACL